MKNIFEETYEKIQEAKKDYREAQTAAGQSDAREHYNMALESIKGLDSTEQTLWDAYQLSRDCSNEYIDISFPLSDEKAQKLIECMKKYGFEAFTFSSSWSDAVETAWVFKKAGCSIEGLIEINSAQPAFLSEGFEKTHGYLFRIN